MAFKIDDSCTKCGACLVECPTQSILEGAETYLIDADTCSDHAICVAICPVDAIQMVGGSEKKIDEKVNENHKSAK